jgi:hypothetical protein
LADAPHPAGVKCLSLARILGARNEARVITELKLSANW